MEDTEVKEEQDFSNDTSAHNRGERLKKLPVGKILRWTNIILLTAVQTMSILMFAFGFSPLFGDKISVIKCVYIIGDLFDYNSAAGYRLITSVLLVAAYAVFFGFMIKNLISTLKTILKYRADGQVKELVDLKDNTATTFLMAFAFSAICKAFSAGNIGATETTLLCVTGFALTFNESVTAFLQKKLSVLDILFITLKFLIIYLIIAFLLVNLNECVILDFLDGWKCLLNGNLGNNAFRFLIDFFNLLILPVTYVFLAWSVIRGADLQLSGYLFNRNDARRKIRKVWVFALVILILHLFFNGLLVGEFKESFVNLFLTWWVAVKRTYLPVFILLTAWRIMWLLTPKEISD